MLENHPQPHEIKLENVLFALGNPIRLAILQTLAQHGEQSCNALRGEIAKSTMTHHWRVLRDSGVIWQRPVFFECLGALRGLRALRRSFPPRRAPEPPVARR